MDEATALWAKIAELTSRERELLVRLGELVGAGLAHMDMHPDAYETPSGEMLAGMFREAASQLRREVKGR